MEKMKEKIKKEVLDLNIQKVNDAKLKLAKAFFQSCPFATKVYVCMKTGLDISFVSANWDKIIK